jgi:hypothetical protein
MKRININSLPNARPVSTDTCNSHSVKSHIYTLENLIQTLEEVANHLQNR